jgi:hypothetical protein
LSRAAYALIELKLMAENRRRVPRKDLPSTWGNAVWLLAQVEFQSGQGSYGSIVRESSIVEKQIPKDSRIKESIAIIAQEWLRCAGRLSIGVGIENGKFRLVAKLPAIGPNEFL